MMTADMTYTTIEVDDTGRFYAAGWWLEHKLLGGYQTTPQDALLSNPGAVYGHSMRLWLANNPAEAVALAEFTA